MKKFLLLLAFASVGALASVTAAQAGATTTITNITTPFTQVFPVSCANGGAGENVDLTGVIHQVFKTTVNDNHFTTTEKLDFPGLRGVGEITGDTYVGGGGDHLTFTGSFTNGQSNLTGTLNEHLNGQGSDPNLTVREVEHTTVNADGTVTVSFDNFEIDCG